MEQLGHFVAKIPCTHLSIFVCLMIGEYDDRLEWPFEGDIYIELLNQREDSEHCSKIINLNRFRHEDDTITSRVIGKKFGSS